MEKKATFDITVIPKSSQRKITVDSDSNIRVYLNSPPIDGKANAECIASFSKALHISKSSISIEKGLKGRKKRLTIEGFTIEEIVSKLKLK